MKLYRVMEARKGTEEWALVPSYRRGKAVYLVGSAAKGMKTRLENRYGDRYDFRVEVTDTSWQPI